MKNILQRSLTRGLALAAATVLAWTAAPVLAEAPDAEALIRMNCSGCHQPQGENTWSRISHQRKTPEGWLMTIARMQLSHGLKLSDADRRTIVKYLADRQGLAPSETTEVRYALERRLNTQEPLKSDEHIGEMCARCHSAARVVLQGRDEQEWRHLVNFHLGHWPSLEYQSLSRDRDWFQIALTQTVPHLAQRLPFNSDAWKEWQQERPDAETLAGRWSFAGHYTGVGELSGVMTATWLGDDRFKVTLDARDTHGKAFRGEGEALIYNGYEWRGQITVGDTVMRQVLAVDGDRMQGRMFERDRDERGLDFAAVKAGQRALLAVQPSHVRVGTEQELILAGSDLSGRPDLGRGIRVLDVIERSPERLRVRVRVDANARTGLREVSVGRAAGASLAVYRQVNRVQVVPDYAVARIGGNGSSTEKVEGRFDAEAWALADDGKTEFRLGIMPAQWSVHPFNEEAAELDDVKFAGVMDTATGVFVPGDAGPNPERHMMANNVGNLTVRATVKDGERQVSGEGQLIVGVQRWVIPPIP